MWYNVTVIAKSNGILVTKTVTVNATNEGTAKRRALTSMRASYKNLDKKSVKFLVKGV